MRNRAGSIAVVCRPRPASHDHRGADPSPLTPERRLKNIHSSGSGGRVRAVQLRSMHIVAPSARAATQFGLPRVDRRHQQHDILDKGGWNRSRLQRRCGCLDVRDWLQIAG